MHAVSAVYRTGRPARRRPRKGRSPLLPTLTERVAVPIRVGHRVWGALLIASEKVGGIPANAGAGLARFAELVALAISEREARDELQWRVAQQAAVNELSALALGGGGFEDLLRAAIDRVALILDVPMSSIIEVLDHGDALVRAVGGDQAATHVGLRFKASPDTLTGVVLADGRSIVIEEVATDNRFTATSAAGDGMYGAAGFVIRLADRAWGTLAVLSSGKRRLHGRRVVVPGVGREGDRPCHRTVGVGTDDPPPGAARRAHRDPEPDAAARPADAGAGAREPHRHAGRRALHRPRPVQGRQRHATATRPATRC